MSKKNELTDFIYAALFAAVIGVMGLIAIPLPISPVPITGQSLAIMLAGSILTVRQAAFSVLTFLLIGAIGVPVFAGGTAGIGIIAGPRGGYLIGFLAGATIISLLKGQTNSVLRLVLANITGGIGMIYIFGVLWLDFVTGMGLQKAIMVGVLPYIPGDILKVIAATFIGAAVNRYRAKTGAL